MSVVFTRNVLQLVISLPHVAVDDRSAGYERFYDGFKCLTASVFNNNHHTPSFWCSLDHPKDPVAICSATFVVFSLSELGFIYFHNDPRSSKFNVTAIGLKDHFCGQLSAMLQPASSSLGRPSKHTRCRKGFNLQKPKVEKVKNLILLQLAVLEDAAAKKGSLTLGPAFPAPAALRTARGKNTLASGIRSDSDHGEVTDTLLASRRRRCLTVTPPASEGLPIIIPSGGIGAALADSRHVNYPHLR